MSTSTPSRFPPTNHPGGAARRRAYPSIDGRVAVVVRGDVIAAEYASPAPVVIYNWADTCLRLGLLVCLYYGGIPGRQKRNWIGCTPRCLLRGLIFEIADSRKRLRALAEKLLTIYGRHHRILEWGPAASSKTHTGGLVKIRSLKLEPVDAIPFMT